MTVRFLLKNNDGVCSLEIRSAEMGDAGEYKCVIQDFAKEGESETTCQLEMSEFQHNFTSDLQGKNVVEDETAVFELGVEEDDAPVTWFKDGKEIVPDGKRSERGKCCQAVTFYIYHFQDSNCCRGQEEEADYQEL